jgi:tetratricopeptide (TPR) repeat protein
MKGTVTNMLEKKKETLKGKFIGIMESFFRSRTIVIWVILGALLVGFIGFIAWSEIDKGINQETTAKAEAAMNKYSEWVYGTDEKKKTVLEEELLASINSIIKDYPGRYAALRASILRAKYYGVKKDWEKSAKYYLETAKLFPKDVLAPQCAINAAIAYEEKNDVENAIKIYTDILSSYKDSFEIPYVLFSLGRVNEQKKNYPEAVKYYTDLEDNHTASNWTLLAQNRKIYLKTIGY